MIWKKPFKLDTIQTIFHDQKQIPDTIICIEQNNKNYLL